MGEGKDKKTGDKTPKEKKTPRDKTPKSYKKDTGDKTPKEKKTPRDKTPKKEKKDIGDKTPKEKKTPRDKTPKKDKKEKGDKTPSEKTPRDKTPKKEKKVKDKKKDKKDKKSKSKKDKKAKTPREKTPKSVTDDEKKREEDPTKKFGPCNYDPKQAYAAILTLKSEDLLPCSTGTFEVQGKDLKKCPTSLSLQIRPLVKTPAEEAIKQFGPCHVDAKQVHTAILMLKSEEIHVVIKALNSLQRFCEKRPANREIFVSLDGIQAVQKLIYSSNPVIQCLVMKLVAMNSQLHRTKLSCRDLNIVADAINIGTDSTNDVLLEYVTEVLSNCATLYTGRLQIIQSGGIPFLINLIATNSVPEVLKSSAEVIWRILEEPLNSELICDEKSIKPIIDLCDSEFPTIQIIAFSILENVSRRESGVRVLESLEMFRLLGKKISNMDLGDLHREILKILINMMTSKDSCRQVGGIMPNVMDLLDTTKDLKAQTLSIRLLGKIVADPLMTRSMVDVGVTEKLISILSNYVDLEIREACAIAAAQLASMDHRAKQCLFQAIDPLLAFLNDKQINDRQSEVGLLTLSIILEEGISSCEIFIRDGGLKYLHKLLTNHAKHTDEALISGLTCTGLVLAQWSLRSKMVQEGFVPAVLGICKRPNPQVLTLGANALCGLLCVEEGRTQFMKHEGYKVFSDILATADEFPVSIALVPLIHTVGSYPKLAKGFIDKGVLTTIWARQDLMSYNGPFRTAYDHLVSSDLSTKFSITGHIDPFELLPDGFYDAGYLKKNEKFQSLLQLSFAERDPEKRVLYLNSTTAVELPILKMNQSLQYIVEVNQTIDIYAEDVLAGFETGLITNEHELVGLIATIVANKFGGPLNKWKVSAHSEDLEIVDLQNKYESVAIPVTMLSTGAHRSRALLFKALADKLGIPCSLDCGGYKKYWNVVLLNTKKSEHDKCACIEVNENKDNPVFTEKLRRYVVDLIYQPGSLFPLNSYEANAYCFY